MYVIKELIGRKSQVTVQRAVNFFPTISNKGEIKLIVSICHIPVYTLMVIFVNKMGVISNFWLGNTF